MQVLFLYSLLTTKQLTGNMLARWLGVICVSNQISIIICPNKVKNSKQNGNRIVTNRRRQIV